MSVTEPLPIGTVLEHPCPDCGGEMVLRNSRYGLFYGCKDFPRCRATHGAHRDGRPLGIPADSDTKRARITAHTVFDRLWKNRYMHRGEAYAWMAREMGLEESEAHIGRFDMNQCERLLAIVDAFFETRPKKMPKCPWKGAPLRKIVEVKLDNNYVRTGWFKAILECGHEVSRMGYCKKGADGKPRPKTKCCYCIQCREPST